MKSLDWTPHVLLVGMKNGTAALWKRVYALTTCKCAVQWH